MLVGVRVISRKFCFGNFLQNKNEIYFSFYYREILMNSLKSTIKIRKRTINYTFITTVTVT